MPELSRFLGIVIAMHINDHNPPHFHVKYNEFRACINIKTLGIVDGKLPPRVLGLVSEWAELHKGELSNNWNSLAETGEFSKIDPLV